MTDTVTSQQAPLIPDRDRVDSECSVQREQSFGLDKHCRQKPQIPKNRYQLGKHYKHWHQ